MIKQLILLLYNTTLSIVDRKSEYAETLEEMIYLDIMLSLFESDNILVVNKPSTVPIYPTGDYRLNTLLYILICFS